MPRPRVTVYGRKGCSPCAAVHLQVMELAVKLGFDVETVDIDTNEEAHARYLFEIPVVVCEGRELAKAPVSPIALEEALRAVVAQHQP